MLDNRTIAPLLFFLRFYLRFYLRFFKSKILAFKLNLILTYER